MYKERQNEIAAEVELNALKDRAAALRAGETIQMVPGPFGKMYSMRKFAGIKSYGFKDPNIHLSEPERLIQNPEPGYHYAWPKADDDATRAKLRDGHYIKVNINECVQDTGLAISTHKGTSAGTEVRWYGHVLVKIPPGAYEELYEEPVERSKFRLAQESEAFKDKIESASKGVAKPTVELGTDPGLQ